MDEQEFSERVSALGSRFYEKLLEAIGGQEDLALNEGENPDICLFSALDCWVMLMATYAVGVLALTGCDLGKEVIDRISSSLRLAVQTEMARELSSLGAGADIAKKLKWMPKRSGRA